MRFTLNKNWLFLTIILCIFFVFQEADAIEITATPEKDLFGPNDWIQIDVKIDDYAGGAVDWNATKPDGGIISGELSNFDASNTIHIITRNAFDNQFGIWKIDYFYKDANKTITAEVEPLTVTLSTDKATYLQGDTGIATFTTNYYEANAAIAESYRIEIQDEQGNLASHTDYLEIKAYQETTTYQFTIGELLKHNPPGTYYVVIEYFNVITKIPFSIGTSSVNLSIFLASEKSLYLPGEVVKINVVVSETLGSNAILEITNPSGKLITKTFPINSVSTIVVLDDVATDLSGTYQYTLEYGGQSQINSFQVKDKETQTSTNIEYTLLLDKKQYRPGEAISATFTTNKILDGQISYWFEDPVGNPSSKNLYTNSLSGSFSIQHVLSPTIENGPWKIHIDYVGVQTFAIFFVTGEPIEGTLISNQEYEGPEVLLIIDSSKTNFIKVEDVAVDSQNYLYVLDAGDSKVKKFDSNGNLILFWGSVGTTDGQLKNPSGIFVDAKHVHVADKGNSRIVTFDKNGNFERIWGNSGIESQSLRSPEDVAVDSSGIYLVSDSGWNKVLKFDQVGKYAGKIESLQTAAAKFSITNSIVSDENRLLILVTKDNRILQFTSNGEFVKSFGTTGEDNGKFLNPNSLAFDANGNIFVADSGNHRIQVLDPNGKFLNKWGTFGTGYAQFLEISGIAVDSDGNVFTADSIANRILKFSPFKQVKLTIPDWIRNNANWWASDQINDDDFALGIQFMIEQKIIIIPDLGKSEQKVDLEIPDWIKNNARWWSERKISDEDFANGIEYMVKNGIIQV